MPLWCTLVRKIQNNCFDQFTTLLLLSTAVCQSSFFYDILDHNIFLKPFSCFFLASLKLNPLTKTEIPGVEKVTLSITVMWSLTFLNCTLYVMILGGSFNQFQLSVQSNLELQWVSFISLCDRSRNFEPSSQPIKCKAKPFAILSPAFSRLRSVLGSDWLLWVIP